jgi:cytochrome c oxidase subunit III
MPATSTAREAPPTIQVPVHGAGGGGDVKPPPANGGGGRDDSGGARRKPPQRRFSVAITLVMTSITMFFLVPSAALIVLERTSETWVPLRLPKILFFNTGLLLASSYTLELARRRLSELDFRGFRRLWSATTTLGILFLTGQVVAWVKLVTNGIHFASTQASSFFYIFTSAHAVHLLGGIAALAYVNLSNFEKGKISRVTAVKVSSYYWHFMDGLWVFLLSLLVLFR